MTQQNIPLDPRDLAVLAALDDDFVLAEDGLSSTLTGVMKVTMVRPAADVFELKLELPGGEPFDVKMLRAQLMDQFSINGDA